MARAADAGGDKPVEPGAEPAGGAVAEHALDVLFRAARTCYRWRPEPVPDALLRRIYELARLGPTSANCQPMRVVFVRTPDGKERLRPALSRGNLYQTMEAPVTAIVAYDLAFPQWLAELYTRKDARFWFGSEPGQVAEHALRNGSLQGAYLILAARALGLDAGPMSGFDRDAVDAAFFAGTTVRSNFLCNLGYGDRSELPKRDPRLPFETACSFA